MRYISIVVVSVLAGCASIAPSVQKELDNTQAALNAACITVTDVSPDPEWMKIACKVGIGSVLAGQSQVANNPAQARVDLNNAVRALGAIKGGK